MSPAEAAAIMVEFYDATHRGEGYFVGYADPIEAIGRKLDEQGGMDEMLEAHGAFAGLRPRAARNLEMVWDGIGSWRG